MNERARNLAREWAGLPPEEVKPLTRAASSVVDAALDAIKGLDRKAATEILRVAALDAIKRDLPGRAALCRLYESYSTGKPYVSPSDKPKRAAELLTDSKTGRTLVLDGPDLYFNSHEQREVDAIEKEIEPLSFDEKMSVLIKRELEYRDAPGGNRVSIHCIRLMSQLRDEQQRPTDDL